VNLEQMDKTPKKIERRKIVAELSARFDRMVATDYPGPKGRAFIRQLHRTHPKLDIVLVNKYSFRKDYPGDSLLDVVTKISKRDIFEVIQSHPAEFVDIDLFGGLSKEYGQMIETAPNWEKMIITFAKVWRHKTKPGLLKAGEDVTTFMNMWCMENHWKPPIVLQFYSHPNKNAIMGLIDARGPKYWTWLLER